MALSMKLAGECLDANSADPQKFIGVPFDHPLADDDIVPGFSRPITAAAFSSMLSGNIEALKQLDKANAGSVDNKIISVQFGKQALLLLLSQPGCEGIQFTFVNKVTLKEADDIDPVTGKKKLTGEFETPPNITLVAAGISGDPETSAPNRLLGRDVILNPERSNSSKDPLFFEVSPPYTFAKYIADINDPGKHAMHELAPII